MMTMMTMIKN